MRILLSTFAFLAVFSACRCSPRYAKDNDDYPSDQHVHKRGYPPSKRASARLADNGYYPPDVYEKGYPQDDLTALEDVLRAYGLSNEGYLPEDAIEESEYDTTPVPPEPVASTEEDITARNMDLASDVADKYKKQMDADNRREKKNKSGSSSEALHSFNAPSDKTRQMDATATSALDELETLALLTSTDEQFVRELEEAGLFDRAVTDPTCDLKVNCHDTINLNMKTGTEYRNINGRCNNKDHFQWGMAGVQHKRLLPNAYKNKRWAIRTDSAGKGRLPSPRSISNAVHATTTGDKRENDNNLAIALFYFMQFIDHDLAKTPEGHVDSDIDCCNVTKKEKKSAVKFCMPISVLSTDDDHFEQGYCMNARRSDTVRTCEDKKVRNQINELTSYMDASMVYGSSDEEMKNLRTFTGGFLKESTKEFLPASATPSNLPCNVSQPGDLCFEAGDTRANVHPGLTTYHTVFVREHNRIVEELSEVQTDWDDEKLFQEGRKIIIAMIQHITYTAVLPKLFSESKLQEYGVSAGYTYDPEVDVSMTQAFSMAFRYHHLMPDELHLARFAGDGEVKNYKNIRQELAYFRPHYLTDKNYRGINEIALGMVQSSCPYVDGQVNNAARNSLFLDRDGDSFDLAALNIMRGREWGMPSYTKYREFCGLKEVITWEDLSDVMDEAVINNMTQVYQDVRDIDLWTGVVSERPIAGSISGETLTCLLAKHFANIKHGDRFWYEADFKKGQLDEIKKTTLARILCSNLKVEKMRENVFDKESPWRSCDDITKTLDLQFSEWNVIE